MSYILYSGGGKMNNTQNSRMRLVKARLDIKPYQWYSWKGYDLPVAVSILELLHGYDKKIDPARGEARMTMAASDLENSIPVTFAANLLKIPKPEFRVGGKYVHGAEKLPFDHHPRLKLYPWIRRPLADRDDIRELYYGEYGAERGLSDGSGFHLARPEDQEFRPAGS